MDLSAKVSYLHSTEYSNTSLYVLQDMIEGTMFGDYGNSPISTMMTHLRIANPGNPYNGEGFSILSYHHTSGSGQGWTYDKSISPGMVTSKGFFIGSLFGIVSAVLNEAVIPRYLSLFIERLDLGLPPMPDLEVKNIGPLRASPGQTVTYCVEIRNESNIAQAENACPG